MRRRIELFAWAGLAVLITVGLAFMVLDAATPVRSLNTVSGAGEYVPQPDVSSPIWTYSP